MDFLDGTDESFCCCGGFNTVFRLELANPVSFVGVLEPDNREEEDDSPDAAALTDAKRCSCRMKQTRSKARLMRFPPGYSNIEQRRRDLPFRFLCRLPFSNTEGMDIGDKIELIVDKESISLAQLYENSSFFLRNMRNRLAQGLLYEVAAQVVSPTAVWWNCG